MVDAAHVFDFAPDEVAGVAEIWVRGGGGEGVAVGDGFGEVFGESFEVELFLLAGFEERFHGDDVGFHVPQRAEVVLIGVFF